MFKRKLTRNDFFLIIANLIPVYGVWMLGWSAKDAFIVYAMETFIIGILTLIKIGITTTNRKTDTWYVNGKQSRASGFLFLFFFLVHYGLFAAVQTAIFQETAQIAPPGAGTFHFFFHWPAYITKDIGTMLGAFVLIYLCNDFIPFIYRQEYKTIAMARLMFQPYGRIFTQQLTVILGSMFLSAGSGKTFILVFVIVKIYVDIYINFDSVIDKTVAEMEQKNQDVK